MSLLSNIDKLPKGWYIQSSTETCGHAAYGADEGSVDFAYYLLLPSVLLARIDLQCPVLPAFSYPESQLATLNWCASGRCEVDFGERGSLVVGEQTLCLSSTLAESFAYPTGSYRGFEIVIDVGQLDSRASDLFAFFGLSKQQLRTVLLPHELGINLLPSGELAACAHAIETELASESPRQPHLLLELCRLLTLLAETDLSEALVPGGYLQRSQRDIARAVYQHLIEQKTISANLQPLVARLGVSEASLRAYFTRVYGESPASFVRTRMLAKAESLLTQTDWPIADVSQVSGYTNPSKFSAAFKRSYGVNPTEYRRRSRL